MGEWRMRAGGGTENESGVGDWRMRAGWGSGE